MYGQRKNVKTIGCLKKFDKKLTCSFSMTQLLLRRWSWMNCSGRQLIVLSWRRLMSSRSVVRYSCWRSVTLSSGRSVNMHRTRSVMLSIALTRLDNCRRLGTLSTRWAMNNNLMRGGMPVNWLTNCVLNKDLTCRMTRRSNYLMMSARNRLIYNDSLVGCVDVGNRRSINHLNYLCRLRSRMGLRSVLNMVNLMSWSTRRMMRNGSCRRRLSRRSRSSRRCDWMICGTDWRRWQRRLFGIERNCSTMGNDIRNSVSVRLANKKALWVVFGCWVFRRNVLEEVSEKKATSYLNSIRHGLLSTLVRHDDFSYNKRMMIWGWESHFWKEQWRFSFEKI